jgi:diadenosine tetraphosphate (Ap4A) HIT family hydrolase
VYEDDYCLALRDINPQAPVHYLSADRKRARARIF